MDEVDPTRHKVVLGNHDAYSRLTSHALTSYGFITLGEFTCYYIRGAHSIDKQYRIPYVTWWPNEELSTAEGEACVKHFAEVKPEFVLSHDCPISLYPMILYNPGYIQETWTARVLEECFNRHQPKLWVFGHHHRSWSTEIGHTTFQCLNELEILDFHEVPLDVNNSPK